MQVLQFNHFQFHHKLPETYVVYIHPYTSVCDKKHYQGPRPCGAAALVILLLVMAMAMDLAQPDENATAIQSGRERSRATSFVMFATSAPVQLILWFGFCFWLMALGVLKRPADRTAHPPTRRRRLSAASDAAVAGQIVATEAPAGCSSAMPMPTAAQNPRYTSEFWGKAWGSSTGGRGQTKQSQTGMALLDDEKQRLRAGMTIDLGQCRKLLSSLASDDLRERLLNNRQQASIEESWLREAASAYSVSVKSKGTWKTKITLIDDVMRAVSKKDVGPEGADEIATTSPVELRQSVSENSVLAGDPESPQRVPRITSGVPALQVPAQRLRQKTPPPPRVPAPSPTEQYANAAPAKNRSVDGPIPVAVPSRRYDSEHWGKHGHSKGGRGKKSTASERDTDPAARAQADADAEWNLVSCRQLLLALDVEALKTRLQDSPWLQGKAPNNVNWLKEAAAAFSVSIKQSQASGASGVFKNKGVIVAEVMEKIVQIQAIQPNTAAAEDEHRRQMRAADLHKRADVFTARSQIPFLLHGPVGDHNQMKEDILLHECPEALRIAAVKEFLQRAQRPPCRDAIGLAELRASQYAHSATTRVHASNHTGPQLSEEQILAWEDVFGLLPEALRYKWAEDPVFEQAQTYYQKHGRLASRKHCKKDIKKVSEEERLEDHLARCLDVVRRARLQDVNDYVRNSHHDKHKQGQASVILLRRKLAAVRIRKWEQEFGAAWNWLPSRDKELYIPGEAVLGSRHVWPRVPFISQAAPCYLCGADFPHKSDLIRHWRQHHFDLPLHILDGLDDHRIEEEIRKRIFYNETLDGPYEVRGQEMRRAVGTHATHQTHSAPGSGRIDDACPG